jgi:beta-1,4-mannosyl-glycoprotein beta-1,4-N-acetylglucosaminyltransferase
MFYDENVVLDIRLNYLDKFVDKFIIVESQYAHNGEKRKLLFNISNFKKFSKKIIYIILKKKPKNLIKIDKSNLIDENPIKVSNAIKRENFQRNFILEGLKTAKKDDIIIVSDIDEIPNLDKFNFKSISNKIYFFEQKYFYYKLNLFNSRKIWYGSRLCKFGKLLSPQWLRNIKAKNYPLWRIDVLFSNKKYFNNIFVKNGGWHFSYLKKPVGIKKKLKTYLHHVEYELNPMSVKKISSIIKKKNAIYDLNLDQRSDNRFLTGSKLQKFNFEQLPDYIKKNKHKFKKWL